MAKYTLSEAIKLGESVVKNAKCVEKTLGPKSNRRFSKRRTPHRVRGITRDGIPVTLVTRDSSGYFTVGRTIRIGRHTTARARRTMDYNVLVAAQRLELENRQLKRRLAEVMTLARRAEKRRLAAVATARRAEKRRAAAVARTVRAERRRPVAAVPVARRVAEQRGPTF